MAQAPNKISSTDTVQSTKPNMPLLLLVSGVSFILLTLLMLASGEQSAAALDQEQSLVVQNSTVEVTSINLQDTYVKPRVVFGQIESVSLSDIGFELGGTLSEIAVVEGQYVKRGETLASIDTSRLLARQNELQSALNSALANAKLAALSAQRIKELVAKNLEPQQRLDEVQAQLDASSAVVSEARARLKSLTVEFDKSVLVAPFEGQIVRQYVDEGTVLNNGQAVFSILAKEALEARFGLPENTAFGLSAGQQLPIVIEQQSLIASVKSVAKQRNRATRTIDSVFSVDLAQLDEQQKKLIVAGDLVSLTVDIPQKKAGAWVPTSALASGIRGLWTLYIVDANKTIQTRLVSIEYAEQNRAYVSGAIAQGDKLVINGIHRLTPNQTVKKVVEFESGLMAQHKISVE